MITLHTFGPAFGLPDPSPFVIKAEVLLKMAGLPYQTVRSGPLKAPKGKLPYLVDDGELIADSTFIRWHLEKKHGADFDKGLSREQRAIGWAFEKMAEEHLYWAMVHARWTDDANFAKGVKSFFDVVPAPIRPLVIRAVRRRVRNALHGQGMGRHTDSEVAALGIRSIEAIADFLGAKRYFLGDEPTGTDATIFASVACVLCPVFDTPLRTAVERRDNLKAYVARMTARWYPELGEVAGVKAAA